jgi:Sap, sulfolipid-1-addressing protein
MRMGIAIGELLPLAVAIAISVTTIITTVLMLLSPKAKSRTVGLMVGCVVGVGGAVALFMLLADLLPSQDSGGSSLVVSAIKIVVGVLLVVLALRQWRGRPAGGDQAELPNWMAGVDSMTPGKALVATSTVAVPVVAHLVASARLRGPFERLRVWLVENNVTIMVVALLVIGVVMIGNSIASI